MANMFVMYAIRNVQTGNFVSYMGDDGSQYEETDVSGNFNNFENEFKASAYLNEKVKFIKSVCFFEIVKIYVGNPY